ncbi:MAG TPA: VCBS repeat-containing protein [Pyrinomonadaceae bacterium]|jgi:hypothetical protein
MNTSFVSTKVNHRIKRGFSFFALLAFLISALPAMTNALTKNKPEGGFVPQVRAKYLAFYGTNYSDWAVVNIPATAGQSIAWKILKNPADPTPGAARISIFNWGVSGDSVSPGSFTGDGTYDPNIFRPSTFENWLGPWETNGTPFSVIKWGTTADNAARNGDYDGDGIMDYTQIRITNNRLAWWIRPSTNPSQARVVNFGALAAGVSTFAFEGADFNGDGRDDLVIAQSVNATGAVTWYIGDAVTGAQLGQVNWGNFNVDFLINPADYTGDGKADFVVWRAGGAGGDAAKWYILNGATGTPAANSGIVFGIGDPTFTNNDTPVRGDYDGDGKADITVYRPGTATFYSLASSNGNLIVQQWGAVGDTPLGSFFIF